MTSFLDLSQSDGFMPHGMCYIWVSEILYMHVGSDLTIALYYFSIPIALFLLVHRSPDLIETRLVGLFAAFIFLCGLTHALGAWVVWNPDYMIQGIVKVVIATVSVVTAAVLWLVFPKLLQLPSPAQVREGNRQLVREIEMHKATERELLTTQKIPQCAARCRSGRDCRL